MKKLAGADVLIQVATEKVDEQVQRIARRYVDSAQAEIIALLVVRAHRMGVDTHGLHYFLRSILPLLQGGDVRPPEMQVAGLTITADGHKSIGLVTAYHCSREAIRLAQEKGLALVLLKNPGKVGALRVFGYEFAEADQLAIIAKNCAPIMSAEAIHSPLVGTNPLCIAIPGTPFIYDASTATVANNKMRLYQKMGRAFPYPIGENQAGQPTPVPEEVMSAGTLYPFSYGPFWFKSFFLGVAVDALAALAGGKTGERIGEARGHRLDSEEGMLFIVIDRKTFPHYEDSLTEINRLLAALRGKGLKIPGEGMRESCSVLASDWERISTL